MGLNKKAVFFSIDALIALTIIIGVILLAYPYFQDSKHPTELHQDTLETLSSIKIGDVNTTLTRALINQSLIIDLNKSLLEQIGEFYATNTTLAKQLASDVLSSLNTSENIGIWYGNTLILSKNKTSFEQAKNVETARQIISGVREGGSVTGYSARAFLSSSLQSKYIYLGGYAGDGNITLRLDYNGNITAAQIEFTSNNNITIRINNNLIGTYLQSPSEEIPVNYSLPIDNFVSGTNLIQLSANNLHLAGGFIKITYQSSGQYDQPTRYYFPGIVGAINLYTGVYAPSQINDMKISLHFNSTYNTFLTIGNSTVFNNRSNGEEVRNITNSELTNILSYNQLSNITIPIRLGLENISLSNSTGNADVVLITDVSGSMEWRLDQDSVNGVTRNNCSDPQINDPSTKRISLARCLDKSFAGTILAGSSNRIALVSFSSSADTYLSLTNNALSINNTVDTYSGSGGTCISCAINRAYWILQTQSNSSRQKFIIVMTDGVANIRSTNTCNSIYGIGSANNTVLANGQSGLAINRNQSWLSVNKASSNTINDVDMFNDTFGFAVGSSGTILRWNGATWSTQSSPVSSTLNGVDIFNSTYALAVGASGRVLRWNGATWSTVATISNSPTLNKVSAWNGTFAFIAGTRGNNGYVYKSTNGGSSWSQDYSNSLYLRGVKILNRTLAFAVGESGVIARWTGSWSTFYSPTSDELYSIGAYNNTLAYAVGGDSGNAVAIKWDGVSWTNSYDEAYNSLQDVVVLNNRTYGVGLDAVIVENNGTWNRNFDFPEAYEGNNTAGITCTADQDSCSEINSFPALNANYSACRANQEVNATVHTIGFGPISSCSFATRTLQGIANCGNGTFYASSNATILQQIYTSIASSIVQLTYVEQNTQIIGNITATLYPDSFIEINYTKSAQPYGLVITTEKQFSNAYSANFTRPQNTTTVDAQIVSYSSTRWTNVAQVNNITVYNISRYGADYQRIGDPYVIGIRPSLINATNTVWMNTATSPTNTSAGSIKNKIIHTVVKNVSGYSPVVAQASGCIWTIQFEDNSNITVASPVGYTGTDVCSFTSASQSYNTNDAFQVATFNILRSLDFDQNYKVDVPFTQQDLQISITETTGIPYTWSTEVQVRVWN